MRFRVLRLIITVVLVAAPLAARAQQPALPVIGYLSSRSPGDSAYIITAFLQGLKDAGFVAGQNVTIEYRFAEGRYDRLPTLATDLIRRPVNVVVATGGTISAVSAKPVVPATIPIVFAMGGDPVELGVVASLARPGGNMTGVSFLVNGLAAKQIQLLRELTPLVAAPQQAGKVYRIGLEVEDRCDEAAGLSLDVVAYSAPQEQHAVNAAEGRGQPWTTLASTCTRGRARSLSLRTGVRSSNSASEPSPGASPPCSGPGPAPGF